LVYGRAARSAAEALIALAAKIEAATMSDFMIPPTTNCDVNFEKMPISNRILAPWLSLGCDTRGQPRWPFCGENLLKYGEKLNALPERIGCWPCRCTNEKAPACAGAFSLSFVFGQYLAATGAPNL
jgi:hypothetical protein